jgi:5'-3' exonuclease
MEIPIDIKNGIVIVDTGYYLFNRYFATLKWYRIVNKQPLDIPTLHEDPVFVDAFKAHIYSDISKLAMFPYLDRPFTPRLPKKNRRVRNKIIMCLDCKRSEIWRMKFYPEYKQTRKQASDMNMNMVGIFHDYVDTLNGYDTGVGDLDIVKMSVDNLEADDVVYLTLKTLRSVSYSTPVLVITNDNDFLQLISMKAVVTNMQGTLLSDRMLAEDSKTSIMLKVLMGDVSDNIKAVPCIGAAKKTALAVASMSERDRQEWIVERTVGSGIRSCIKAYKLNKKLIILSNIPKTLTQNFLEKYKLVLKSI